MGDAADIVQTAALHELVADHASLRRENERLKRRLARVLRAGRRRECALRYETGAPMKGGVWSGRRSPAGGEGAGR